VLAASGTLRSFVDDAVRWHRTGGETSLRRVIRSSCSGVAHDVAAAYATLSARTGALLDAIERELLSLPAAQRDSILLFAKRMRRVAAVAPEADDDALRAAVAGAFELPYAALAAPTSYQEPAGDAGTEIELAQPRAPEAPRGVPAWQKHFSPSALNTYAECARKWFYRYVCAAVEDPGSAASAYGSAFHLALEDFHGEFPRPTSSQTAEMRRRIAQCVTWAFERNRDGFATAVEFELQVRRAQRTAQRYIDWLLASRR